MNIGYLSKKGILGIVCVASLFGSTGCSSLKNTWNGMTQTGQGATAGGAAGAAVGAGIGALIGGGKGTWIGALVGSALGAGTGAVVGNQMQRQKDELERQLSQVRDEADGNKAAIDDIKVQMVKDSNNLDAIKLVLGNSVLFNTGSYQLSAASQAALAKVAYNLGQFPDTDVTIVGYTDNTGTEAINEKLSQERADAVMDYLINAGVPASRLKAIGRGWNDPVASNATPEGRAQNRRVEIYITADKQMIQNAENQAR
ncbi:MAG: OmpA family protein [Muribaculaceae bacterium]|nr:OmpA family protein [Muribaculaceae bacterium]MDE6027143.1 OmpA family protein [Muribaculaceae bacterium]